MSKVIVITGAGGVLCGILAKALAEQGHRLALLDLNKESADSLTNEIIQLGGTALSASANVLDKNTLIKAKEKINKQFGSCDILINGAGGNHPLGTTSNSHFTKKDIETKLNGNCTFFDLDPEGIKFVFDLNFLGTLLPSQIFVQDMLGKKGCSVLNISSMNAYVPLTKIPAYSAAKAAVSNFTKWLAVYFAKMDIRVNALAPGFFLTEQNRTLLNHPNGELTARGETIIDHTPMGRFGDPEDLIGATLWLCGDRAKFITGVVIPIDGGFSAFSGV